MAEPEPEQGEGGASSARDAAKSRRLSQLAVGARIEVYWPDDGVFYAGVISAHHPPNEWQSHVYTVNYDDGEVETIDMENERFRVLSAGSRRQRSPAAISAGAGSATGSVAARSVAARSEAVAVGSTSAGTNSDGNGGAKRSSGGAVKTVEVKSLTVRFNQRRETWRSPPTYGCEGGAENDDEDDEFSWPDGWIEVQRLEEEPPANGDSSGVSAEGGSSPGNDQNKQRRRQQSRSQRWVREFHPPGLGGKTKVCRSLDEVRRCIEQCAAKQAREERRKAARDGSGSSSPSRPRRVNGINPSAGGGNFSPNGLPPHLVQGTSSELHKLMKRGDSLSGRMRQAILIGAVLARKRGTIESAGDGGAGSSFLGANGRVYPDLRQSFGKHVKIKQCSLCKSRVQGHWYCRIAHAHLDKPDYDGGRSAEGLVELFRCTVEDLEGRLQDLLSGGGRMRGAAGRRKEGDGQAAGFSEGTGWSMNALSEDILYHVASFLPTLSQLSSFCATSRRARRLLHGSVHSEKLLRGIFLRQFGQDGTRGNFERDMSWRERWSMVRGLRRGLLNGTMQPPSSPAAAASPRLRGTVGVLPAQDEAEAVYYDNPEHIPDPDRAHCNGYFGMEVLHLPRPPSAGPDWQQPVVVRGDFNGIKIFISGSSALFCQNGSEDETSGGSQRTNGESVTLGGNEEGGQALSLIQCDVTLESLQRGAREGGTRQPCCFVGYASGKVAAVAAALTPESDGYTFTVSTHHAHESEVTDLTFVNCGSAPGDDMPVLFSACCAGKVYFYPDALSSAQGFSMDRSVLAFANFYNCPIFSMASTVVHSQGRSLSILCTGDRDGNIRIWLKPDDDLVGLCTRTAQQKFRHIQLYKSSTHRGTGCHLVTRAMFVKGDLLITGTNNGDVRFWQLRCIEDPSRSLDKGPLPNLTLRYDLMGVHNGAVELLMNVGDVLLSSGGNDGKITGWDISSGLSLGCVPCHPGTRLQDGTATVRSCVVDLLISGKAGSLISLCRDGSLKQLKLDYV